MKQWHVLYVSLYSYTLYCWRPNLSMSSIQGLIIPELPANSWSILHLTQSHIHHYNDVINHQPCDCLLNHLFMHRWKKHQSSTSLAFVRGIQRYTLKFHTKYLIHTLKGMIFIQHWNFKAPGMMGRKLIQASGKYQYCVLCCLYIESVDTLP